MWRAVSTDAAAHLYATWILGLSFSWLPAAQSHPHFIISLACLVCCVILSTQTSSVAPFVAFGSAPNSH